MSKVIDFPNKFSVSPEYQKILSRQVIDEKNPGGILHDFEILLNIVGPDGCRATPGNGFPSMNCLSSLNEQMSRPLKISLKRPAQKSFPHIEGLYLLARASGMMYIRGSKDKKLLVLNESVRQIWQELNFTERYFTLLETWLLRADPEIIGERCGFIDSPIRIWARFFHEIPDQGLKIGNTRQKERIAYGPGFYLIALLELFGFISVAHGEPEKGKGWCIRGVTRTPFGDAMLELLSGFLKRSEDFWLMEDEDFEPENVFGELRATIQPLFPKWQKNLELPVHEFQEGMYVFKISIGKKIWRRIAMPSDMTLDHLSEEILDAFDFDSDHLYSFIFRNRIGVLMEVRHPYMDDNPPCADEFLVGDLPVRPGESMTFLYDFGDHWEFDVELEKIENLKTGKKRPMLLESQGQAPRQYEYSDEEQ